MDELERDAADADPVQADGDADAATGHARRVHEPDADALGALLRRICGTDEAAFATFYDATVGQRLLPGVRVKHLGGTQRAVLLELAPGAALPVHRHHEDEECVVLRGEARLGETVVRAGDYHLARANSRHGRVSSQGGALLYLGGTPIGHAGETLRDLVSAWLPGDGEAPRTVRADERRWTDVTPGVHAKLLREDAGTRSRLMRLEPGAGVAGADRSGNEECLVLDGEAFFGDALLRAGDYQRVPAGSRSPGVASDAGTLLFLRDARDTVGA